MRDVLVRTCPQCYAAPDAGRTGSDSGYMAGLAFKKLIGLSKDVGVLKGISGSIEGESVWITEYVAESFLPD